MGMYTGLRFKGTVKEEFRKDFEPIALGGEWINSDDPKFKAFGTKIPRALMIPIGSLAYMPACWEEAPYDKYHEGVPTDGFDRSYDPETGYWSFQCSLKNYDDTIKAFLELVPYFMESVEHAEVYYEEWVYSTSYIIFDGRMQTEDPFYRKYRKSGDGDGDE